MRIAPRFNAGNVVAEHFSPEGTAESDSYYHFSAVPSGLVRGPPAPRVETRGYFRGVPPGPRLPEFSKGIGNSPCLSLRWATPTLKVGGAPDCGSASVALF